jgi:sorbitol-specific phosphotransferase system component IIBC
MTFGYFRLICENGLVVPVEGKEAENIHIIGKHTAKILESLEQLMEKVKYSHATKRSMRKSSKLLQTVGLKIGKIV